MNREDGSAFGIRRWAFGQADSASRTPSSPATWAVMLLAAALQVWVVVWRSDQLTVDRDAYLGIATNLVEGRGFSTPGTPTPTAYRPPLYPLLLAAAMSVLPAAWAVAAVNVAAGLITVWLVLQLGNRLDLGRVRFVAGLLTAVNPLLLYAMPQPMTEVVFTALTTAWWWAVVKFAFSPLSPGGGGAGDEGDVTGRHSLLTRRVSEGRMFIVPRLRVGLLKSADALMIGVLFGLAAMCRPTIWPLAGLMTLAWVVRQYFSSCSLAPASGERGRAFRIAFLCVFGTLLVVAPWVVRNQLVFGRPILTTTHGGYTLRLANNHVYDAEVVRRPWGTTWSAESLDRWQRELHRLLDEQVGPNAGEWARDRWIADLAKKDIWDQPDRFFAAMLHRIRSLWAIWPRGEGTSTPLALRGPVAAFFAVEFLLAIIGVWIVFRRGEWRAWLPGLLLIVTIQAVHLAYWTDTRMRTPLEPVLALFAARACCALFARRKEAQG